MTRTSNKNKKQGTPVSRWLIVALGGFVGGLFLPVFEYQEYGTVSTFKMLLPVITMTLALGTAAIARLVLQQGKD